MQRAATLVAVVVLLCLATSHAVRVTYKGNMDRELELRKKQPETKLDLFSSHVFDPMWYLAKHPYLRERGITTAKRARRHWINFGIQKGLQGCPLFSAKVYLEKNQDVRDQYGPDNYPYAVIHFLQVGIHEPWRETGGSVRVFIYNKRAFDWSYYLEHNGLKQRGLTTEQQAKDHWRDIGLNAGLMASENFWVKHYLHHNVDLIYKYGMTNYRAALAHWLAIGYKETWRDTGGTACKYWATWCHDVGTVFDYFIQHPFPLPTYNDTGFSGTAPPLAKRGGFSVSVNGRDCSDLGEKVNIPPDATRVEQVMHIHSPGKAGTVRPCNVFVRHFVDIQTRQQGQARDELSLKRWIWPNAMEHGMIKEPVTTPAHMLYEGFDYDKKPSAGTEEPSFHGVPDPDRDLNITVTGFRMEAPGENGDDEGDDRTRLEPEEMWELVHVFQPDPNAPGGRAGAPEDWRDAVDAESRRAFERLPPPPPGYQQAHIPTSNFPMRSPENPLNDHPLLSNPIPIRPPPKAQNATANGTDASGASGSSVETVELDEEPDLVSEAAESAPPANRTAILNATGASNATSGGEGSAEGSAEVSGEESGEASGGASAEVSAEESGEASAEASAEASGEESADASAEASADATAEASADASAEASADASAEASAEASDAASGEASDAASEEASADASTGASTDASTDAEEASGEAADSSEPTETDSENTASTS